MTTSLFQFRLDERVVFANAILLRGIVVARMEATDHPPRYLVRHQNKAGDPTETWVWASEIAADVSTYDDPNFDPKTQGHL